MIFASDEFLKNKKVELFTNEDKKLKVKEIPLPQPSKSYFDVDIFAIQNKYTSPLPEYLSKIMVSTKEY
jgi:hypothetical protein